MPRIIESVLVDDDGPDQSTELDQRVPFPTVTGEARSLNRKHSADIACADRSDQAIEAGPGDTAARSTKIVVDDLYARPPELSRTIGESVLATSALMFCTSCPGVD
jgi:hypothetical protein